MITSINRIMNALEGRIFMYGLQLCALFRLLRSINEFSTGQSNFILLVGIINLIVLVLMLTLFSRYKTLCFITLHVLFLITSCLTWSTSGGYQGIIPYAMVVMVAFVIFTSRGALLALTLILYTGVTIYLAEFVRPAVSAIEPALLTQFNFLLCTFLLVRLCVFAKNRFVRYGEYIGAVNKRLDVSAAILNEQATQLKMQGDQLVRLRSELENKIEKMHLERDQKREMLLKFAYVNAHHVRGPVARILGLVSLMELEPLTRDGKRYVQEIKSDATDLDNVIRRINDVLSD